MGKIRTAPPGKTCHQTRNHRNVAGKRKKRDHGLRGSRPAGYELHHGMERGDGFQDPFQDSAGGGEKRRVDVMGKR